MKYHLAQINVARMKGANIEDPIMQGFVDRLDEINEIAESSPGFVWRLKDETNNATSLNLFNDIKLIINASVWESIGHFESFVFNSAHLELMKDRKTWFYSYGKPHMAMWWIKAGHIPSHKELVERLNLIQEIGSSNRAFDFRNKYPAPA